MKLNLKDVTLVSADCVSPKASLRAIKESQKFCDFGRSILFTDSKMGDVQDCEVISVDTMKNVREYEYFILKQLNSHINTDFVLIIQWDGYVVNPKGWSDEFRNYDYIGARWPWYHDGKNIGNGGFTLRSKKLLEVYCSDSFPIVPDKNCDDQICRIYRDKLEAEHSIKFADERIADMFSYERTLPNYPTFGFHALSNMWRHCDDSEMMELIEDFGSNTYKSCDFTNLMIEYFKMRKFRPIEVMYPKIKTVFTPQEFAQHIHNLTGDGNFAKYFVNFCEKLVA